MAHNVKRLIRPQTCTKCTTPHHTTHSLTPLGHSRLSSPMEISKADIVEAARVTGTISSFCTVQTYLTNRMGRKPTRLERLVITNTLKELRDLASTNVNPISDSIPSSYNNENEASISLTSSVKAEDILVCTAYSADYTIGSLCELVNKEYAKTQGYCIYTYTNSFCNIKLSSFC